MRKKCRSNYRKKYISTFYCQYFRNYFSSLCRKWSKRISSESSVENSNTNDDNAQLLPHHCRVTVIKSCEGGFLCGCGPDKVFVFQRSENIHEYFTQVNKYF